MSPKINKLIRKTIGRKKKVLIQLKKLNKKASNVMVAPRMDFRKKYSILQTTTEWKEARDLLFEYFSTNDYIIRCGRCKKYLTRKNFIIHHTTYNVKELFTPSYIQIVCRECHQIIHQK